MARAVAITAGKFSKICPAESGVPATNAQLSELLNRMLIIESLVGRLLTESVGFGRIVPGNPLGRGGAEGEAEGAAESNESVVGT